MDPAPQDRAFLVGKMGEFTLGLCNSVACDRYVEVIFVPSVLVLCGLWLIEGL